MGGRKRWDLVGPEGKVMPLFEFKCEPCDIKIELIQKAGDHPPLCCKCMGRMAKQVSRASFILKGGGWYKDGYSSSPSGNDTNEKQGDR